MRSLRPLILSILRICVISQCMLPPRRGHGRSETFRANDPPKTEFYGSEAAHLCRFSTMSFFSEQACSLRAFSARCCLIRADGM